MGCCFPKQGYLKPKEVKPVWFQDFEAKLPSLEGKVVCITGCTTGTGYICARTVARKGAHVVMLNRKSERSEQAEQKILSEVPNAKVTSVDCDLQSFQSVRAAAKTIQIEFAETGIDVLCNNAGVMALADVATKDGYDVQMQTNHLSHFLLTRELMPLLEKAASLRGEARIVNHSSGARKRPFKPLDGKYFGKNGGNLGGNGNSMFFGGARWQRYQQSKLANAVFMLGLHDRLQATGSKVKALCAAPGLTATNLQVTANQEDGFGSTWIMRWAQAAEDGTMSLLQCCVGQGVQSGEMYEPSGRARLSGPPKKTMLEAGSTDPTSRQILWTESEKACGEFKIGA